MKRLHTFLLSVFPLLLCCRGNPPPLRIDLIEIEKERSQTYPLSRTSLMPMGDEWREVLSLEYTGAISFSVDLFDGASLSFGYGLSKRNWDVACSDFLFEVKGISEDGRVHLLHSDLIKANLPYLFNRWRDTEVSLSPFGGRSLKIVFSGRWLTEKSDVSEEEGIPVISNPVVTGGRGRTEGRKNIILFVADALRYDHITPYGAKDVRTENMMNLSRKGVTFVRAYTASPWTFPSISSLLISLPPTVYMADAGFSFLPPEFLTLSEVLRKEGYQVFSIVNNSGLHPSLGMGRGFHRYIACDGGADDAEIIDRAISIMDGAARDSPFFLYIHLISSHLPYGDNPKIAEAILKRRNLSTQSMKFDSFPSAKGERSDSPPENLKEIIALYDSDIEYTDLLLGQLLRYLDESGIRKGTVFIFTSDHGEEFFEHNSFEHGHSFYEEVIRVPLIVEVEGIKGKKVEEPVSTMDIAPFILESAGIDVPEQFAGRSFTPLMYDKEFKERVIISEVCLYGNQKRALIGGKFKYILPLMEQGEFERYDLMNDPHERSNLVASRGEEGRNVVKEVESLLKEVKKDIYSKNFNINVVINMEKEERLGIEATLLGKGEGDLNLISSFPDSLSNRFRFSPDGRSFELNGIFEGISGLTFSVPSLDGVVEIKIKEISQERVFIGEGLTSPGQPVAYIRESTPSLFPANISSFNSITMKNHGIFIFGERRVRSRKGSISIEDEIKERLRSMGYVE